MCTVGKNVNNSLNFGIKTPLYITQNTGNFSHFYIAGFEASLKYVILKCFLINTLLRTYLKIANA